MPSKRKQKFAQPVLCIEGELTILRAAELKGVLLDDPPPTEVDLSGVTEIDTAGIQLLMLAQREARSGGRSLHLLSPSVAVSAALDLLRLPLCHTEPSAAEH
jgi:anti-anti-sigma regulatory factor